MPLGIFQVAYIIEYQSCLITVLRIAHLHLQALCDISYKRLRNALTYLLTYLHSNRFRQNEL